MRAKLFILFILSGITLSAQKNLADSVQLILNQQIPDSARAYNMVMLAMYTEPFDLNKAHEYYKAAVDFSLSRKLDYYAGLALFYEATPYSFSGKYGKQRDNLTRAINLLSNSKYYKAYSELARAYGGLSGYYRIIEKFDSAVIYSLKSINIQEELKNYKALAISCINLSMIYQQLKIHEKQKEYVDKGLMYAKTSGDRGLIMVAYLQQAHYCTEINDFQKAKMYVDSSSVYYSDKYDFSRKQNYFLLKANTFQNINQYDSAVFYFQKCYETAEQINSHWNMTEPLMQIGYIYLQQKKYDPAEKYLKMGLQIAEEDSIRYFMKEGYGTLSDIYAATGRYKNAYELILKYNELKDTILSEEKKKFTLELEKKYESEKQLNKIHDLEASTLIKELSLHKRALIIQALIGITFTLLIISLLLFRNYKQKQRLQENRIQKLEAEKLLSATEAVLKGEEQERTRLAKDLHDGLGGMLSGIKYSLNTMKGNLIMTPDNAQAFERSLDMLDSSIREMRRVAHNMMPEVLITFGLNTALKDFCNEIDKSGALKVHYQSLGLEDAKIGETTSITIYRIVQELINNTMKHASAKNAIVQLNKTGEQISITVEDDGKGFDTSILKETNGIGWMNILNRVEFLKGKLDVKSDVGKGTSVYIEINTNDG